MSNVISIFKREFLGYFATPIAYVFLAIFVFLSGIFTFYMGSFFDRGQADATDPVDRLSCRPDFMVLPPGRQRGLSTPLIVVSAILLAIAQTAALDSQSFKIFPMTGH